MKLTQLIPIILIKISKKRLPGMFKLNKKHHISVDEDSNDCVLNLSTIETLVREIYNIDLILDNIYKSKIVEKTKCIIRKELMNLLQINGLESEIMKERNDVINQYRKSGKNIIYISSDSEIRSLFSKKYKVHYSLYKYYKKKGKTKYQIFELLNFLLDGFEMSNYMNYNSLDLLNKSIEYKYVRIKRKYVAIDFLKLVKDTENLGVKII